MNFRKVAVEIRMESERVNGWRYRVKHGAVKSINQKEKYAKGLPRHEQFETLRRMP